MTRDVDNALAPLEVILRVVSGLAVLAFLGGGLAAVWGDQSKGTCVQTSLHTLSARADLQVRRLPHFGEDQLLTAGTTVRPSGVELCDPTPSASQHIWQGVDRLTPFLYAIGVVVGAWMLVRTARRQGLFSPHLALAVGHFGLYVLLGTAAVTGLQALAQDRLLVSMADPVYTWTWVFFVHVSWAALLSGFGILTVGRVMAQSVRMQREIDATV
jgi:hypothetical protein